MAAARCGTALPDPRLRSAAAEWAHVLLRPLASVSARARRVWIAAGAFGLAVSLVLSAYRLLDDRPEDLNFVSMALVALGAVWWTRRRSRLRRALATNATC